LRVIGATSRQNPDGMPIFAEPEVCMRTKCGH
jgi:hypothetical protein